MEFKTGQILNFAYNDSLFEKLIKFVTKSKYIHSGIITSVGPDFIEIAEALSRGFVISNYERWWVEGKIKEGVISIGESKSPLINVRDIALKYQGTPYGFMTILHIANYLIFRKKAFWSDGTKSLICSEAVARILYDASDKKINFETEYNKSYDEITPGDLERSKQIKWL